MPSGQFHHASISSITIPRPERQRRELPDLTSLADSISRLGLIHPIVLTRDLILVAGECRLEACRTLGWTDIPFQYVDETDPLILHCIELEENIKRKNLSWQDENDAIARYHELRAAEPEWTIEKSADALGLHKASVSNHLLVKRERSNGLVDGAEKFSTAIGAARRIVERRAADEFNTYSRTDQQYTPPSPILHGSFLDWAPTYAGPKFNLIHCDFPYGIIHGRDETYGGAGARVGDYTDSVDIYFELLKCLAVHLDNFCASSAHIIFWFHPNFFSQTWELLKLLDGFAFDEVPLIWFKDDNSGIVPDPSRRPRRGYETAFFGWRNDRKILRVKTNIFPAPIDRTLHPHEKSQVMLQHFFEMVVDPATRLLDPTCGSGSALRAAKTLGAEAVFGIERDKDFAEGAAEALRWGGV